MTSLSYIQMMKLLCFLLDLTIGMEPITVCTILDNDRFGLLRKDVCAFMPFVNDHSPSVFLVKDWLVHHMNDILVFLVNDWLVDLVDYLLQIDRLVMLMYDLLMNLVH